MVGIEEHLRMWAEFQTAEAGHKPFTATKNARIVGVIAHAQKWACIGDITPASMREYLDAERGRGNSPKTLKNKLAAVNCFCEWAVTEGVIESNPLARVKVREVSAGTGMKPLSYEEVRRVIAFSDRANRRVVLAYPPRGVYYAALFWTGLRVGELNALLWSSVHIADRTITVDAYTAKNRHGATIVLADELAEMLAPWQQTSATPVFPIRPSHNTLKRDLERCGIDPKCRNFHSFRKGLATSMSRSGAPDSISVRQTRHRSTDVFARSYVDPQLSDLRAAVEKIGKCVDRGTELGDVHQARPDPPFESNGFPIGVPHRPRNRRDADGAHQPGHRPGQSDVEWSRGESNPRLADTALVLLLRFNIDLIRLLAPEQGIGDGNDER